MSASPDSPIIIAYDGSDEAKAAIEAAGDQLRTPRRALVLTVRVHLEAVPFWGVPITSLPPEIAEIAIKNAKKTADEGVELAAAAGFDAEPLVELGDPVWRTIVDAAEDHGAGLIVLGSHGRSAVTRTMMGSVATSVAHHAKQPVLIARSAH